MYPHASIAMDAKKPTTITRPICGYYNGCEKLTTIYETYMWVLDI
jgi:hypothetical protein